MSNVLNNEMGPAGARLLKTPEPLPDESLMGYILRLTEANYYESPHWLFDLAGLRRCQLHQGWRVLCTERADLTRFSRITGLTADEMEKLKHPIINQEEFGNEDSGEHIGLPAGDLNFWRPRVCPECLHESGYCRKLWDLHILTACPHHRVPLLDWCPACGRRLSWNRKSVCLCSCGFDWRRAKIPNLESSQCRVLKWLMRSQSITPSKGLFTHECAFPFQRLGFYDLSHMLRHLAAYFPLEADEESWLVASGNYHDPFHQALESVVAAFDNWPDGFLHFCELSMQGTQRRFLPVREAQRTLEITNHGFETLLSTGKVRAIHGVSNRRTLLVDGKCVEELLVDRRWMLTEGHAAYSLGITGSELLDLIHYDCLPALSGPHIDGFIDTRLDPSAVTTFYKRLAELADDTRLTDDVIGLEDVGARLRANNLNIGHWMRAVLDGEIAIVRVRPERRGPFMHALLDFAFVTDQVRQYIYRRLPSKGSRAIEPHQQRNKKYVLPLPAMTIVVKRKWDNQRVFTRQVVEMYDVMDLRHAARMLFQQSKRKIH